ncbi:MAG TPA: DUF4259 domain-containing protein [Acidimicrobiia bacterium]|jgi:hypothetical protein
MGAWDIGPFDNDDAADWVWKLDGASDYAYVVAALAPVARCDRDAQLAAWDASVAVAAAESLAAAAQRPGPWRLPESVCSWIDRIERAPTPDEREVARAAVQRAGTAPSELLEMWNEAGADEWLAGLGDLDGRLAP